MGMFLNVLRHYVAVVATAAIAALLALYDRVRGPGEPKEKNQIACYKVLFNFKDIRGSELSPTNLHQFACVQQAHADISTIYKQNVTLYAVDIASGKVAFVETAENVDPTTYPFYYIGQYKNARRMYILSMEQFLEAAERMGAQGERVESAEEATLPFESLTFLQSTGRCGSTLLSKIFSRCPTVLSLSEPDCFSNIFIHGVMTGTDTPKDVLKACIIFTMKVPANRQTRPSHLVIKTRSMCFNQSPAIVELFPQAHILYMYRDALPTAKSFFNSFSENVEFFVMRHMIAVAALVGKGNGKGPFSFDDSWMSEELRKKDREPLGNLALMWIDSLERYIKYREGEIPQIAAIRYELLVQEPTKVVELMLERLEIEHTAEEVVSLCDAVMTKDSQAGTSISKEKKTHEFKSEQLAVVQELIAQHPLVNKPDMVLPGTLGA